MLLQDGLIQAAAKYPDLIAFDDEAAGRVSLREFLERTQRLAGALADLGVNKSERIAILARNCTDYIAYHYAAAMLGAIFLPLNVRHTDRERLWVLNDAEAAVLIVDEHHKAHLTNLTAGCPSIRLTIGLGSANVADHATRTLVQHNPLPHATRTHDVKDPILLIYTSGTTGRPKGALQTHQCLTTIDTLTNAEMALTTLDVYFAYMPYFHQAGLIRTRATLIGGGKNVVVGKIEIDKLVTYLIAKRITVTMLVPPLDTLLLKMAAKEDLALSSLRIVIGMGGIGPVKAERMRRFCEKFQCQYRGLYGQTETSGPSAYVMGKEVFTHPYACGKARKGIDIAIWDENRHPVPPGVKGEIMVRGKTTITGYWKNDQASRALYTGAWLHSGDMGKLDEAGYLYFLDRKNELIKTGGENVYPQEVELVLFEHPAIEELTVMGMPDPDGWGETVTAVVVLKPGCTLTLDEVKTFCREKIAGYKIPKILHLVDTIPRNFTNKVDKRRLQVQLSRERTCHAPSRKNGDIPPSTRTPAGDGRPGQTR